MRVNKQAKEAQLQHIFRMLLESHTYEEIARELNIGIKTVYNYALELDKRYGQIQTQKTNDTIFTECQLFKNRMLKLYKILEDKAKDPKTNGTDTAKCAEVAANIAIDVLKADVEGIKAIKELVSNGKEHPKLVESIQRRYRSSEDSESNNSINEQNNNIPNDNIPTTTEQDPNFKF